VSVGARCCLPFFAPAILLRLRDELQASQCIALSLSLFFAVLLPRVTFFADFDAANVSSSPHMSAL